MGESRREQVRLQEELAMKEKALRDTQIGSMHEMREMKRAQELRVVKFSVQKLRENHDTIQRLTSQMRELQERVNGSSDSGEFQEVESNFCGKNSHVPCQPAVVPSPRSMLSRDKRLPLDTWNLSGPQENVFGNPRRMFRFITNTFEGILHSAAPSATGAVPVHGSTGTPVARDEERLGSTIPNADVCRKAVDHELLFASGYSTEFCVGQQRQQILELQFDKIPTLSTFSCWKIRFKKTK